MNYISLIFFILLKFAAGVVIDEDRQDHFAVVTGGIEVKPSSIQSIYYPEAIKLSSTEILIDDMWWFGEFGLYLPIELKILNFQSDLRPSKGFLAHVAALELLFLPIM